MYQFSEIRQVHLEMTTKCNASCPQCPRNINGGITNPELTLEELTLDQIKRILSPQFISQLELIFLCGNYGDPMVAKDTLAAFNYFRILNSKIRLHIHTNGSGRDPNWWKELAQVVDVCIFGIDGLADTNHIYRRGTNWKKIMESANAFIQAGGHAEWQFLVFDHNEHQVEQAMQLSRQMGFQKFFLKQSSRFLKKDGLAKPTKILDRRGAQVGELKMPTVEKYQNRGVKEITENKIAFQSYLNTTDIVCKAVQQKRVYITSEGLVFPCCWLGGIYPVNKDSNYYHFMSLIDSLPEGRESINALEIPLTDILNGPFFQQMVPESWHKNVESGRIITCAKNCGALETGRFEKNIL